MSTVQKKAVDRLFWLAIYLILLFGFLHQSLSLQKNSPSSSYHFDFPRTHFLCRSCSQWNWSHDNSITLPSKHIYVLPSSMGSIDVMLPQSSQKNMTLVHINITSNGILIVFINENRHLTQIRYLDTWTLLDPPNIVGMMMQLCL